MSLVDELTDTDEEQARSKRINGAVTGLVTNNKDPEGLGRVKLKFPWLSENNESDWVRIAYLMAGKKRGTFFLPEVGDEVLVVFEHGDIDYPYIIGALWSSDDTPTETNADGKNNIRKITSRSGHEIIFNDDSEQEKEKLEIHTKAGHKIVLDDSSGKEKIEIRDKAGNEIVVKTPDNSIFIACSARVTISAKKEVIIDTPSIKLGASASKTLVTDVFFQLYNAHTHTGNQGAPTSPPTAAAQKKVHSTTITRGA